MSASTRHRRLGGWSLAFALGLSALLAAGCESIVGAECADGFELCEGRCVAVGTCGSVLDGGMDAAVDDAAVDDAAVDDAAVDDAAVDGAADASDGALPFDGSADGSTGDGSMGDASLPPGCDLGEILCDDLCVDGRSDPLHCGGCGIECPAGELCARGRCTVTCVPPLVLCGGRCIDVSGDPDNCGGCGIVCASGICIDGECSGPLAGHVVALGHDYETRRVGMNQLAGNALFLARGSPVRVVVYEGGATAASRAGSDAAFQQVATATGRTWTRTVADASEVGYHLADADALVIYAQRTGADAELRDLGAMWARTLESFLRRGGVVVMFETTSTSHAGTWQILDAAGLFSCTARTETTGSLITVIDPADSVALRVPLVYMGERATVRFDTSDGNVVCSDGTGPVVVHRTLVP